MIPIYKKEMRNYFSQMIGYLLIAFFMLVMGIYFVLICVASASPEYYAVLSSTTIMFFIFIPALTMRLFAEETRHKTDQLIFTSPLSVGQIVVGKFLAAFSMFLIATLVSLLFPLLLSMYGPVPVSQIAGAYLGYVLIGACFIAVGLLISVMTDNQIVAFVGTFVALFMMFIIDGISSVVPTDNLTSFGFVAAVILLVAYLLYNSTKNMAAGLAVGVAGTAVAGGLYLFNNLIYDSFIVKVLQWLSVYGRYDNMINGILNLNDVVYYLSFTALFIYLTVNVIEKRRWR